MSINIELLHYSLEQVGLPILSIDETGKIDYSRELTSEEQTTADNIVLAHDPNRDLPWIENKKEAKARFLISQLADKTPQEIYTLMQNRMDNWTTLADARSDLREWLPLMAALMAWTIGRE